MRDGPPREGVSTVEPTVRPRTGRGLAIDVHSHYVPRGWPDLAAEVGTCRDWPSLRIDSEKEAMILVGSKEFRAIGSNSWDAETRLADMDADGVDVQVVSPTPVFFGYDLPGREAVKVSRIFNDLGLEVCAPAADRLLPFAQVPLQDPDAACVEADRCMANGHVGVEIGNHVGDRDLDDEGIVTFLQHCAENSIPVFVHPWDMASSPRLDRWMARWTTGMPAETHLSIVAMILGGVFDRIPDTLKICFAHGGGSFAFWLGRLENAWFGRGDVIATSEQPPSHYVGRFSVDSVVFDPIALRTLVDTLGPTQVMVGSDYPYPLGERPVGAVVHKADYLTDEVRSALLGGNAARFLGLDVGETARRAKMGS
ncbi:aminocarboxymuconate-semialdehyde decarboxylase [Enemella dayhoffiae]|uniref:2-amino-3-carboxymuconate-6-semialdehyde decarboxylase n=1 Tax=Enemella dayhoffiae TaxID=2016507 RepID=A0A255H0L9_9ACTN|nr:aminocarboxymuconate-semialdehyde decarboxylase [Enemella dayhoffiae]